MFFMRKTIVASSVLCTIAAPALAHHSGVMFDDKKEVTLTGVVTEFQYTNPHSWLFIEVTNADGSVTKWGFEAEGPSTLTRAGISKSDLLPGTKVTITGHPMRDGRPAGSWVRATRADGKELNPFAGFINR